MEPFRKDQLYLIQDLELLLGGGDEFQASAGVMERVNEIDKINRAYMRLHPGKKCPLTAETTIDFSYCRHPTKESWMINFDTEENMRLYSRKSTNQLKSTIMLQQSLKEDVFEEDTATTIRLNREHEENWLSKYGPNAVKKVDRRRIELLHQPPAVPTPTSVLDTEEEKLRKRLLLAKCDREWKKVTARILKENQMSNLY